jgi:hypothetical protein
VKFPGPTRQFADSLRGGKCIFAIGTRVTSPSITIFSEHRYTLSVSCLRLRARRALALNTFRHVSRHRNRPQHLAVGVPHQSKCHLDI